MQVTPLADVKHRPRRVAVGEFDGVHLGHREVISGSDTVLTFEPHPAVVVHPERAPKLLTSLAVKADLVATLGVQELVVIPFDQGFAHQSPQEFIDHVLVERLGATHVSVGDNFHFGFRASGDVSLLRADPRFETRVVSLVEANGETISSSRIRSLIAAGDVRAAARILGAEFRIRGPVVGGDKRGRELGFPTANIVPDPALIKPADGVYACRAGDHAAAVNVGVRPTFGNDLTPLIEAYLIDFTGDLYGQELTLEFVARLRGELAFDNVEDLVAQMRVDVENTRKLVS
ncbi:MAG: bifunctional riboflavin kinase/FAD synthetase [Solirubrobacterales bacterium]|nr:bifunctional riboflavin kinase/FAD synthetase [Solirubrobacterales bacterium]